MNEERKNPVTVTLVNFGKSGRFFYLCCQWNQRDGVFLLTKTKPCVWAPLLLTWQFSSLSCVLEFSLPFQWLRRFIYYIFSLMNEMKCEMN